MKKAFFAHNFIMSDTCCATLAPERISVVFCVKTALASRNVVDYKKYYEQISFLSVDYVITSEIGPNFVSWSLARGISYKNDYHYKVHLLFSTRSAVVSRLTRSTHMPHRRALIKQVLCK